MFLKFRLISAWTSLKKVSNLKKECTLDVKACSLHFYKKRLRDIRKINSQFLLGLIKTGDILVKQHIIEILVLNVNHESEKKAAKNLQVDIKMQ